MPMCCDTRRHGGFTLVELVMVLSVVGALAVLALPRMPDLKAWRLRAYADQLAAQSMSVQRLALVQRRQMQAVITPVGVTFAYVGGDTVATLACPAGTAPCISEPGSRTVIFNAGNQGGSTTSGGAALPVTLVAGASSFAFQFESETGLFRRLP